MKAKMAKGELGQGFGLGLGFAVAGLVVCFIAKRASPAEPVIAAAQGLRRLRTRLRARRLRGGVTVRGGIMGISTAPMGAVAPDVEKQPGGRVTVTVDWLQQTTDFKGDLISWPFAVRVLVSGQGKLFQSGNVPAVSLPPGATTSIRFVDLPLDAPAGTYTVSVLLTASDSTPEGIPGAGFVAIDDVTAPGKVIIPPQAGPAIPGGSIGSIALSQRFSGRRFGGRR